MENEAGDRETCHIPYAKCTGRGVWQERGRKKRYKKNARLPTFFFIRMNRTVRRQEAGKGWKKKIRDTEKQRQRKGGSGKREDKR